MDSTSSVVGRAEYKSTSSAFFGEFDVAIENVKGQILKLETRQEYDETGNEVFDDYFFRNEGITISDIKSYKEKEAGIYAEFKKKYVDFMRCRVVEMPLSDYLRWEFLIYDECIALGERIFLISAKAAGNIFEELACHDFMVFDARFAFVHDYDEKGLIQGGWVVSNQSDINRLIEIFSIIKANSVSFQAVYPNGYQPKSDSVIRPKKFKQFNV